MRHHVVLLLIATVFALLQGCAGPTVLRAEIPILSSELSNAATNPGETKVLLFNNSNKLLFGADNTGRIGVFINGKGLGVLQIGQYVQVSLPKGTHKIDLVHVDILEFRSSHEVAVGSATAYVEVFATLLSNGINVFDALPEGNYLPKPFEPYVR